MSGPAPRDQVTPSASRLQGGVDLRRHDFRIPFTQGLELASRIRGSRLVPLDTRNHLLQPDEPAWEHLLREIDAFLADDESSGSPREVHVVY